MRRIVEVLAELVPARAGLVLAALATTVGLWLAWGLLEEGRRKQLGTLVVRNPLFYISLVVVSGIAAVLPVRSVPEAVPQYASRLSPTEQDQPSESSVDKPDSHQDAALEIARTELPESKPGPGQEIRDLEPLEAPGERWYITQSLSQSYFGASALPGEEVTILDKSGDKYLVSFEDGRQASLPPSVLTSEDPRIFFEMVRPRKLRGYLAAHVTTGFMSAILSLRAPERFWDKELGAVSIDLSRVATIETTSDEIILVTTDGTQFVSTNTFEFVFIFGKETIQLTKGRERLLRRIGVTERP